MLERRLIAVEGIVQGVGFRPYVHRLAAVNDLRGSVRNGGAGVLIDVEGETAAVDAFCMALSNTPPPLARISGVRVERAAPRAYEAFRIVASEPLPRRAMPPLVPPDVATCPACLAELFDPSSRRFGHPFITCTDCGPRFTIVRDVPYDRARTTMADFAMCDDCHGEYTKPGDRRFHAEAIACWSCGPTLRATRHATDRGEDTGRSAITAAVAAIRAGRVVALKSLGGYQLACDATNPDAVALLRARKDRATKPFAIMVPDMDGAFSLCVVSARERLLLESDARPVVLMERQLGCGDVVSASVAPGQHTLGVMLPFTPLHHLLLAASARPLVMTSGNRSGDPVAIDEIAAFDTLTGVADLFLVHDRAIAARCDDSVVRVVDDGARSVRRSRGYVPRSIALVLPAAQPVLALGGHLKNTICVASGRWATLSAHIGDLDAAESRRALRAAVTGTLRAVRASPCAIAHDRHPEYASTSLAQELAAEMGIDRRVAVQHHHAHVAACVAEHGERGRVIGVAFDGAGLGSDEAIWGGEFLLVDGARFERCGHLAYVPLPGGDAAARRPWRSALAHLAAAGAPETIRPAGVDPGEWRAVCRLLARPELMPRTSSAGRLFDAVASLLGLCHHSHFEGEAAMALESAASPLAARSYPAPIIDGAPWTVNTSALVRAVADDRRRGVEMCDIAGAFHHALADVIVLGCARIREHTGVSVVALGGGVFINALLLTLASRGLAERGFRVLAPREVPCNDGGLSLGQAWVAARALEEEAVCA